MVRYRVATENQVLIILGNSKLFMFCLCLILGKEHTDVVTYFNADNVQLTYKMFGSVSSSR